METYLRESGPGEIGLMPRVRIEDRWWNYRPLAPAVIALAAFLVDLGTPQGSLDGYLYVLAILACIWLPMVDAALYAALFLMPLMIIGFIVSPDGAPFWVALCNRMVGIVVIWGAAAVVWHHARLLRQRNGDVAQLRGRQGTADEASHEERSDLGRWLQHGIGRDLAVAGWRLAGIIRRGGLNGETQTQLSEMREQIGNVYHKVLTKVTELFDSGVDPGELPMIIERYVADFRARTGLEVTVRGAARLMRLPQNQTGLCERIVQEALCNILRHAAANRVRIEFRDEDETVIVSIVDDGFGRSATLLWKPHGGSLAFLHDRVTGIGGEFTVFDIAPRGVQVIASIPAPRHHISAHQQRC